MKSMISPDIVRQLITFDHRSLNAISQQARVSNSNLSNWTRHKGTLSTEAIERVASALGAEVLLACRYYQWTPETIIPLFKITPSVTTEFRKFVNNLPALTIQNIFFGSEASRYFLLSIEKYRAIFWFTESFPDDQQWIRPITEEDAILPEVTKKVFDQAIKLNVLITWHIFEDLLQNKTDLLNEAVDKTIANQKKNWKDVQRIAKEAGLSADDLFKCIEHNICPSFTKDRNR